MSTIQFVQTTPQDLINEIRETLIPELKKELSAEFQPKDPTKYLTRSELCELLQIDLSTLHRWRKDGYLTAYSIGNRVYFKRNEIEEVMDRNRLK